MDFSKVKYILDKLGIYTQDLESSKCTQLNDIKKQVMPKYTNLIGFYPIQEDLLGRFISYLVDRNIKSLLRLDEGIDDFSILHRDLDKGVGYMRSNARVFKSLDKTYMTFHVKRGSVEDILSFDTNLNVYAYPDITNSWQGNDYLLVEVEESEQSCASALLNEGAEIFLKQCYLAKQIIWYREASILELEYIINFNNELERKVLCKVSEGEEFRLIITKDGVKEE